MRRLKADRLPGAALEFAIHDAIGVLAPQPKGAIREALGFERLALTRLMCAGELQAQALPAWPAEHLRATFQQFPLVARPHLTLTGESRRQD